MTIDRKTYRAISTLRHSARISPILMEAVDVVEKELLRVRSEEDEALKSLVGLVRSLIDRNDVPGSKWHLPKGFRSGLVMSLKGLEEEV